VKRDVCKWCGVVSFVVAIACFAYWIVSVSSDAADFSLYFGNPGGLGSYLLAANGSITVCDDVDNLKLIEFIKTSRSFEPAPSRVDGWSLPGFVFNRIAFRDSPSVWSLNMSLLIPFAMMILTGGLCVHRQRSINTWFRSPER
jgi:hypothetical protein